MSLQLLEQFTRYAALNMRPSFAAELQIRVDQIQIFKVHIKQIGTIRSCLCSSVMTTEGWKIRAVCLLVWEFQAELCCWKVQVPLRDFGRNVPVSDRRSIAKSHRSILETGSTRAQQQWILAHSNLNTCESGPPELVTMHLHGWSKMRKTWPHV